MEGASAGMPKTKRERSMSQEECAKAIKKVGQRLSKRGEKLLHGKLPEMILTAARLCEDPMFSMHEANDASLFKLDDRTAKAIAVSSEDHAAKRRKIANGTWEQKSAADVAKVSPDAPVVPSNARILKMMDILKLHYTESMEVLSTMKMWIQLNIPKIQDGNNFAVSVQEECIQELSRVEDACFTVLESMSKYFSTRGRLLSKSIKYPNVLDYRRSIEEVDAMEAINLKMCAVDLRNNHAILHDTLVKNFDKLKMTKGGGSSGMSMMY